ncbi:MAG: hypothetical protein UHY90_06420 [Treponema sp.]|nr:hypothetical protein [Spirochaetia bacterium]MDD7460144.1 hypothetical protein [Spirochaetales bacterium]MDY5810907.1 hypothetical protein [Treponema sp.]MEE1181871.1 hypothetical protein [Treponema sp.]
MKNIFKKIFLHAAAMFFLTAASYALPGVVQYIPDTSGEYVFYKDKSFKTETIVGFLYYNESTYAARIYSPANEKAKTTEKDITIYVNVDSSKAGFTMTGEKIDGSVDGNYELVNYLHDMLYEFAKRRQNITLAKEIKTVDDDFNQFGGAVKIKFNSIVPLFNIEGISAADGSSVLQLETCGLLASSTDTSFTEFKGVSGLPKDKKRVFKKDKHAEDVEVSGGNQKITLDTQWKQSMQNLWLLGDYALLSINQMNLPANIEADHAFDILARRFSLGSTHSYVIWQQSKITKDEKQLSIMNVYFQPDTGNVTRDFKIITKNADGNFSMLAFTVFDGVYQKSRYYFDTILKSYKVE